MKNEALETDLFVYRLGGDSDGQTKVLYVHNNTF